MGGARADDGSRSIFHANIFYPHDNALAFSEGNFVGGAIAAPAWLLTKNPYAAHNFFFIACFVLSSVATYYLVRHLTGDWRAAAIPDCSTPTARSRSRARRTASCC